MIDFESNLLESHNQMSLETKSKENWSIVEYCNQYNCYNVGASRAYYAVFQKVKKYLIDENFDYPNFLKSIGRGGEKLFSHGTIVQALLSHLTNKNLACMKRVSPINKIDNIYKKRKDSDYNDKMINHLEFKELRLQADEILKFIDSL